MNAEDKLRSLLDAARPLDDAGADALFSAMYTELHELARRELRRQAPSTIGATTLLHETYLDLAGRDAPEFADRRRFVVYAAKVMRGLIIDHLRERQARKRGGEFEFTATITELADAAGAGRADLSRLGDALEELERVEPALAEVVDLKFFGGFSFAEIAGIRGVCERTVQRQWGKARLYLHRSLSARQT